MKLRGLGYIVVLIVLIKNDSFIGYGVYDIFQVRKRSIQVYFRMNFFSKGINQRKKEDGSYILFF